MSLPRSLDSEPRVAVLDVHCVRQGERVPEDGGAVGPGQGENGASTGGGRVRIRDQRTNDPVVGDVESVVLVIAPPVTGIMSSSVALVTRSSTLSPARKAIAVVPSCARTMVNVSVLRAVTLTISMFPDVSIKVTLNQSPAVGLGNKAP